MENLSPLTPMNEEIPKMILLGKNNHSTENNFIPFLPNREEKKQLTPTKSRQNYVEKCVSYT